jgi:hypothetical protein
MAVRRDAISDSPSFLPAPDPVNALRRDAVDSDCPASNLRLASLLTIVIGHPPIYGIAGLMN